MLLFYEVRLPVDLDLDLDLNLVSFSSRTTCLRGAWAGTMLPIPTSNVRYLSRQISFRNCPSQRSFVQFQWEADRCGGEPKVNPSIFPFPRARRLLLSPI